MQLIEFIKKELFKFIFNPENRSRIKPAHISACHKIDASYSITHSPYIIAALVKTNDNPDSFEDFNSTSDFYHGRDIEELFTYDKLPQLLHEPVVVELPDKRCEAEHGLRSFLPATGPAHFFRLGDESRVTIGTLWWRLKGEPKHECFYQPGEYGISFEEETPPISWAAITTTTPVFVCNNTSSYDASEVDFIVGTTNDPLDFYRNDAWAGYSPHDESPHQPQEESYRESLDFIIRSIIGKWYHRSLSFTKSGDFSKTPQRLSSKSNTTSYSFTK